LAESFGVARGLPRHPRAALLFHKIGNVLSAPKTARPAAKKALAAYGAQFPKAVAAPDD
jgi:hypothetical protein